jgi:hypothetical protein
MRRSYSGRRVGVVCFIPITHTSKLHIEGILSSGAPSMVWSIDRVCGCWGAGQADHLFMSAAFQKELKDAQITARDVKFAC